MRQEYKDMETKNTPKAQNEKNSHRSPYMDMGLVLAISIFITMTVKGCIFGFTWSGIALQSIACIYFIIYIIFRSKKIIMNVSTTTFIIISALSVWAEFSIHKNIRPQMPNFHGIPTDTTETEEELDLFIESIPVVQETVVKDSLPVESDSIPIQPEENSNQLQEETDSITNNE